MKKLLAKKKTETSPVVQESPKFTDLRQVMDYKKPFSIHFSGVEYETYLDILYNLGIRNFLMSYEYLKGKGLSQLKKYPEMRLFIDSGAYTYMNDPKYENYTIEQWEEQIKQYLKWTEIHRNQIFAICDLDLQYIVGFQTVYEWRKKYFEPFMLRTGIPVCFMYHDEGMKQWEYMCKRYPYVGLSLAIDNKENGREELLEMFRIAERYNTLCQGMASTNTSMLTEFPFYTVDSTTWNVGLKYGEISVWNSTKMSRVKKADFQTKAFPVIAKYDVKFDFDKILDEDKTEMIRVNAYAFVAAEKYINERLKSRMYWFKARATSVDLDNLPADFFPPPEWLGGDRSDYKDYCSKMNINPEYEFAADLVTDATALLNWNNPDYSEIREWYSSPDQVYVIDSLHDNYVNRIVPDKETKISDLIAFFRDCVSGKSDKLLQLGTNFDRLVKERESYIEEDDTELVDLPMSEIKNRLHNLLPDKSFEDDGSDITALDEEIYKQAEIVPTFDEHGKFIKGQVEVRKPKQVYSKKFPKLACDTCFAAAKCPEYKSGYVCAYNKMFDRFSSRDMADIIQGMQGIVDYNMQRMQKSMIMETINGSIDPTTTQLMETNVRYLNMLRSMYENGSSEVLKQTRIVRSDGTTEETTSITNPQSGGIMEKLFSSLSSGKKEEQPIVDTTASEGDSK